MADSPAERVFPGEEQAGGRPWPGKPLCFLGNAARQTWGTLWGPSHCLCHMPWETLLALLRWKEQVTWPGGVPGGLWRGSSHSHFLSFPQGSPRGSPLQQPSPLLCEMGFPEPPCTPLAWWGGDAFLPCSGASEFLGELTSKGPIIQVVLPSPRQWTSSSSDDFAPGANLALFEMALLSDQQLPLPSLTEGLRRTFPPKNLC